MAKPFRPTVFIEHNDSCVSFSVPTYREVKRNLKKYLDQSSLGKVSVFRHRRGEWGEWFENWEMSYDRKPKKVKEGWS